MASCGVQILLWVIMAVLVTLILSFMVFYLYLISYRQGFINEFDDQFNQFCDSLPPITYRRAVYIPFENGVYEKRLATALLDISFNTTKANCTNVLPIPNPPKFNNQLRVEGPDPITHQQSMFAYIFWNRGLCHACISFTGTETVAEWQSNVQFEQVAPTSLNGYTSGVLVHKGFYNIYLSIRNQLWDWWNKNSWVKTLYITGHSLGAALSTICAYDFADVFVEDDCDTESIKPIHYSFAAPRSGNVKYSRVFTVRMPTSLRINNTEDIIPQLPPATFRGYTYEQTRGSIPFTISLGSLKQDHVEAYAFSLPECAQVADCYVE